MALNEPIACEYDLIKIVCDGTLSTTNMLEPSSSSYGRWDIQCDWAAFINCGFDGEGDVKTTKYINDIKKPIETAAVRSKVGTFTSGEITFLVAAMDNSQVACIKRKSDRDSACVRLEDGSLTMPNI